MQTHLLRALIPALALTFAGAAYAQPEPVFDYGCEPRSSWCDELTCTFDGSASSSADGDIVGWSWYFRRYLAEDRESETATRTGVRVTHTYTHTRCRSYTYYATLEVTDALGNVASRTEPVDPSRRLDEGAINQSPIVDLAVACTGLDCLFDASGSYDPDGEVVSYDWDFGDGTRGAGCAVMPHTYAQAGRYLTRLTIADDEGALGTQFTYVDVMEPGFHLSASGRKVRGTHYVELRWAGSEASQIDVYRDGVRVATVANAGSYTDATGRRGTVSYTHQVCEAGTSQCSNSVTTVVSD